MSSHMGSMDEVDPASPSEFRIRFLGWSSAIPLHSRIITVADLEELVADMEKQPEESWKRVLTE